MEFAALGIAVGALVVSLVALALSLGTALRVQRLAGSSLLASAGLLVGERVPRSALAGLVDEAEARAILDGKAVIGLVSRSCQPCHDAISTLNERLGTRRVPNLYLVETGEPTGPELRPAATFVANWIADPQGELQRALDTRGTPHFFVLAQGVVEANEPGLTSSALDAIASQA